MQQESNTLPTSSVTKTPEIVQATSYHKDDTALWLYAMPRQVTPLKRHILDPTTSSSIKNDMKLMESGKKPIGNKNMICR
jgi:hypothetical protein